jgi:hypothetical protein
MDFEIVMQGRLANTSCEENRTLDQDFAFQGLAKYAQILYFCY